MGRVSDFKEHLEAVWSLFGGCLLCSVWAVKGVIHSTLIVSIFLTNTSDKQQGSVRGQNGVEFHQEFNGYVFRGLCNFKHNTGNSSVFFHIAGS